jgi:hypothetical protein
MAFQKTSYYKTSRNQTQKLKNKLDKENLKIWLSRDRSSDLSLESLILTCFFFLFIPDLDLVFRSWFFLLDL